LDQADGALSYVPELLRVKGRSLLSMSSSNGLEAEACFRQSLELSSYQGAGAWQLRTAVDLADLLVNRGRSDSARALLQPLSKQFSDMANTVDMKAAKRLLATLN
jgi:predicted ATPase